MHVRYWPTAMWWDSMQDWGAVVDICGFFRRDRKGESED